MDTNAIKSWAGRGGVAVGAVLILVSAFSPTTPVLSTVLVLAGLAATANLKAEEVSSHYEASGRAAGPDGP